MTLHPCKFQKKRQFNFTIFELLVSGNSLRRMSLLLNLNRKTIVRKFVFLGQHSLQSLERGDHLTQKELISSIQFDDMETFEHTKYKPLSIPLVVESKSRKILGFKVAQMPAKGLLVKKALKKYGARQDERQSSRLELFTQVAPYINKSVEILSDENPHYPLVIKKAFPDCQHKTTPGRRGCVVGQGELKEGGFDPLFSFNHTAAMLRANINRLFRKTWNTTKKRERLKLHIALYTWYHNEKLLDKDNLFITNKTRYRSWSEAFGYI